MQVEIGSLAVQSEHLSVMGPDGSGGGGGVRGRQGEFPGTLVTTYAG